MKVAIYIEDGVTQLVLTPEGEWEKNAVGNIEEGAARIVVRRGSFYECQGGWHRYRQPLYGFAGARNGYDHSLILRVAHTDSTEEGE